MCLRLTVLLLNNNLANWLLPREDEISNESIGNFKHQTQDSRKSISSRETKPPTDLYTLKD